MENSIRERILRVIFDRVKLAVNPLFAYVFRTPTIPISKDQSPAIVISLESDEVVRQANDRVDHKLLIKIIPVVRGIVSSVSQNEADLLLVAAHNELMKDVTFGGLATGFYEVSCDFEMEDSDNTADIIPAKYAIEYRVLKKDMTKKG